MILPRAADVPYLLWRFFLQKVQGDKYHGQCALAVRNKETVAIVAALHKFHAWLQQSTLLLKSASVATDHRSLEYMTKESGAVGRRGRWHQFLSQFLLDVVYLPGRNQEILDTLSRWSYPAYLYSS